MNIIVITTHLDFGGIASYVLGLAQGLGRRGHKVFVASGGGALAPRLATWGVGHIEIDIRTKCELSPKLARGLLCLAPLIRREGIEIIHAQTRVTQALSCILGYVSGASCVSTCHGYFRPRLGRRMFGCWGKRVIAISQAVFEHLRGDFGLCPDRIRLVYSGVGDSEQSEYSPEQAKRMLGLAAGPVVGIVARLSDVKGHRYLIQAMREVLSAEPAAQLLVVGDGPYRNELLRLIKVAGIEANTSMLPAREGLDEVFSAIDVYVSPSVNEGLGLSLLEAMGREIPVAAFRTGGICNVVVDEESGLLVPPGDSHLLAGAILRLIRDKGLSRRLASAGRRTARERFSLDRMVEETIKVYQEVLNEKQKV